MEVYLVFQEQAEDSELLSVFAVAMIEVPPHARVYFTISPISGTYILSSADGSIMITYRSLR
jgi:hypothetical protein